MNLVARIRYCSYHQVMSSNGLAPGQIYPASIPEILRVMRPGGYLLWTMRAGCAANSQVATLHSPPILPLRSANVLCKSRNYFCST